MRLAGRSREVAGEGRLLPFLIALVAFFLLYPIMVELDRLRLFRLAFAAVTVFAVYSVSGQRRHVVIALALGVPAAVAQAVVYAAPSRWTLFTSAGLGLAFLGYVTAVILSEVLRPGPVTADKIAGAISVYLLLGLLWAFLYGVVAVAYAPARAAFQGTETPAISAVHGAVEFTYIYYSFATLTTLGYGDISPITPASQGLAWMEAVTGQLFLAILIARLVALHIADQERRRSRV